ncbi:hypothetical protein F5882DRAFT_180902 [Hyaloscypha sp. PMI_1271]|nr:hypothetical protein F5882DRAFT_180902 [Hyaloscypha sp. PMI_1271]
MEPLAQRPDTLVEQFRKYWQNSTEDSNLTLHGFRRFKTTHLLNLRFLEGEIAELDRTIYQAGLSLGLDPSATDRLGLKHCKRNTHPFNINDTINHEFISKLRILLREYDEALAAFNNIMAMETFSLLDNDMHSSLRHGFNVHEMHKTRLVRVDLGARTCQDPFQRQLHKCLRSFRYWNLSRKSQSNSEGLGSTTSGHGWSYQNTIFIAEVAGRFITATITGTFLIVPLVILSHQSRKNTQLVTVSICLVCFSFLVSIMLRASNMEVMVVSAAYAAVLSVFLSALPGAAT